MRSNNLLHLCFRSGQSRSRSSKNLLCCWSKFDHQIWYFHFFSSNLWKQMGQNYQTKFCTLSLLSAAELGLKSQVIASSGLHWWLNSKDLPGATMVKPVASESDDLFCWPEFSSNNASCSSAFSQELVTQCCKMRLGETTKAAFPVFWNCCQLHFEFLGCLGYGTY